MLAAGRLSLSKQELLQIVVAHDLQHKMAHFQVDSASSVLEILLRFSPSRSVRDVISNELTLSYACSHFHKYFICESILDETLAANGNSLDLSSSLLNGAYLSSDPDLLTNVIGEHLVNDIPLN